MAEERTYPLLPEDKCLTEQQLFDYIDGKLPDAERHLAEKHMLDCPLCADALEGLQLVKNRDRVAAFVLPPAGNGAGKVVPKVIPLNPRRRTLYAIAAALVLLLGISVVLKLSLDGGFNGTMADAAQEHKAADAPDENAISRMDTTSAPADATTAIADSRRDEAPEKTPGGDDELAPPPTQIAEERDLRNGEGMTENEYKVTVTDANGSYAEKLDELSPGQTGSTTKPEASKDASKTDGPKTGGTKAGESDNKQNDKDKFERQKLKSPSKKETTMTRAESAGSAAPPSPQGGVVMDAPQEAQTEDIMLSQTTTASDSTSVMPKMYPLKPSDKDLDLSYTNGVKMLESGQATASLPFFDQVIEYPQHRYFEDAQWKKAEALIQLNRKAEAKTLLNEIVKKGGKYKSQAEEKLKTL